MVTQFYAPEPGPATLPSNLAETLARRGHEVRVVTGFPNYPTGRLADGFKLARRSDEVRHGVAVRRVYLYPDHGSAAGRMANYGTFGLSSVVSGVSWLSDADAVWVNASPITLAWPIWALRAMRLPVVSHILDLWPESLFATGFGRLAENAPVRRALDAWTGSIYRSSHLVAYISPGVHDVLRSRGVPERKLRYVPMWADEATFAPGGKSMRNELGIAEDSVVLAYAGALGEAQGLETLIDACREITDPRFVCIVAGSGGSEQALRARARDVTAIRFIGRIPQPRMTDLMASIDASYVSLRDTHLGRVSTPSKTQAALAAGVPVVAAARGDVRRVIENARAGLGADPSSVSSVVDAIRQFCSMSVSDRAHLAENARRTYETKFSLERGAAEVEKMLQQAASDHRKQVQPDA